MNSNITDHENDSRIRLYDHICNILILCNWPARYLHTMFVELMFPAGDSGLSSAALVSRNLAIDHELSCLSPTE